MSLHSPLVKGKARGESSSEQGAAKLSRRATRVQLQAQEEADFFKDNIPLNICWEVEGKVEDLWNTMKNMPKEELHHEVVDWVLDPGSTARCAMAYDRLLMNYWVNMKMVGHSYMEREAKMASDEELVREWKHHNGECHLIHQKVDVIASRLGVSFFSVGKGLDEAAHLRDSYKQCSKKKRRILSPSPPVQNPLGAAPALAHPIMSCLPSAFQKME